jgi:hypothetical protein
MKIIIAGCGGGYDIFGGIPLYLRNPKETILINLSFTSTNILKELSKSNQVMELSDSLYKINAKNITNPIDYHFAEYYLSKELDCDVFVIPALSFRLTIQEIYDAYLKILELFPEVDTLYLIDGGCDILLRGNETNLATPVEDMMSLYAVHKLSIPNKFIGAIGLNTETRDGVLESEIIERLKYLEENGILIEKRTWDIKDPDVARYVEIVSNSHPENTTVQSLICASLEGNQGFCIPSHLVKMKRANVYLNELTKTYVLCNLNKLYQDNLYVNTLNFNDNL